MPVPRTAWGPILTAFAICSMMPLAQAQTANLRARFEHETNPVAKSKLMVPLGEAEFQDIRKDVEGDNPTGAVATLKMYRDEVHACETALDAKEKNPEKHSSGFKELQISLRESLRRLNEISSGLTADEQQPFLDVRKDLEEMNHHLVEELFPGRPEDQQKDAH